MITSKTIPEFSNDRQVKLYFSKLLQNSNWRNNRDLKQLNHNRNDETIRDYELLEKD